jgi:hypothetical protein
MREQKQRDKEEEKRRQEAAELKLINFIPKNKTLYFLLEIIHRLCNLRRCDRIRYERFSKKKYDSHQSSGRANTTILVHLFSF